jgi:hypothetical protein
MRRYTGPRPTLGTLQRKAPWLWLCCEKCQHHAPFALAAAVIRWGPNASSDKLRQFARCTVCRAKAARRQAPSWAGEAVGVMPFPVQ